jgi:hypothetical protein
MAKGKNRRGRDDNFSVTSSGTRKSNESDTKIKSNNNGSVPTPAPNTNDPVNSGTGTGDNNIGSVNNNNSSNNNNSTNLSPRRSIYHWCLQERQGIIWVLGCAFLGGLLGFGIGSGIVTGEHRHPPNAWRVALGAKIRSTTHYRMVTFQMMPWDPLVQVWQDLRYSDDIISSAEGDIKDNRLQILRNDPSHLRVFAVLREAVVRERGGYVHPDLGPLVPAPSGAARGLGMVRDSYHACQTQCMPGLASEKWNAIVSRKTMFNHTASTINDSPTQSPTSASSSSFPYKQEEVLLRIPLSYQMTRTVALDTLLPRVSTEVQRKSNLHELDDAILIALLLAHERGIGRYSRWLPYIASLPLEPSCGYSRMLRPYLLDSVNAMREELGMDVNGWSGEMLKATQYADRIANSLTRDFGSSLQHPKGVTALDNIQWALCQVVSRGVGGSQKHGALRMIPILDMVNHDAMAGGFVELTGKERLELGDFVDATEDHHSGMFVLRSLRHGRRKALRKGQELLANYNVPHYSPLDWFVSLGFVPPERWDKWKKLDAALPKVRRDGPFAEGVVSTSLLFQDYNSGPSSSSGAGANSMSSEL